MKKVLVLILTLCFFSSMVHGDVSWASPVTISTALTNASDPHTVIDSNGNATAVWVENNHIKASSLPFGGSWSTPVTLSNVLNTASTPKLGIDSSGNVTALWIENTVIESATLPFGGSWSAESLPISGLGASSPSLTVDSSGHAVAVWVRSGFIESSTRIAGLWSLVSVLSAANSDNPHVAISSFGQAIAAWHSVVSGSDVIVTDLLTIATNTWGLTKNVFTATASIHHNYPKVALDASGNAAIAWFRYNLVDSNAYENVQVVTATLTQGSSAWGSLTLLSSPAIRNPADLTIKLGFDVSGNLLAVWTNSVDGESFDIESSLKLFGGSFQNAISFTGPGIYNLAMDVAIASGTALVTNMAWDGVSTIVMQSQQTDTTDPILQRWTFVNTFSTGDDNGYPKCALSLTGSTFNAVAVWISFNGVNNVIQAATGTDTAIVPPSSVTASQSNTNFGVYDDFYNTITWAASTDPDLIQYNIYRNGVYFTATDPSTLSFVDHNQINGGTVTYGVGALTSEFRQSAIITYTLFP